MADKHWKRREPEVAKLLGGIRLPNNGKGQPDVIAGNLAVQVKTRRVAPQWLLDALDQAATDADTDQLPAVVLCLPQRGVGTRRVVVVDPDAISENL